MAEFHLHPDNIFGESIRNLCINMLTSNKKKKNLISDMKFYHYFLSFKFKIKN